MGSRRKAAAAPAAGPGRRQLAAVKLWNSNQFYYGALAFVGALGVGLVLIYLPFGSKPSTGSPVAAPTAPVSTTATTPPPSTPVGSVDGCTPQDEQDVAPESVATSTFETTWVATGQMSVPSSPTGGPTVAAPAPHCFNRNPEGALYSIATFVAEMAGTNSNQEKVDVITRRSLRDGNFDSYVQKLQSDSPVTGEPLFKISGYRWQEYSPQRAVAEIQVTVLSGPNASSTHSLLYGVIWANNDWLLLVPSPTTPVTLPGSNLRTFHPWGGTG